MRYYLFLILIILFAGCADNSVEFNGTIAGSTMGTVMIKDANDNIIFQADVSGGKFQLKKQPLGTPGFYTASTLLGGKSLNKFELYLEPGSAYTIAIDTAKGVIYPEITSTSKEQTALSGYYAIYMAAKAESRKQVMALDSQMQTLGDQALRPGEYDVKLQELRNRQLDANKVKMAEVFEAFIKKYPESEILPHLMINTEYQLDPVGYYNAFKKLNDDAKSSPEGKVLDEKLKQLTQLAAGGDAPPLEGSTPDGKALDIKSLNKKILLLDFWRARNSQSADDHSQMISKLLPKYAGKGLGIVSVSFDDNKDQWLAYIAKGNLNWPQIADLKGDSSPNAEAWGITKIPTYYLLDGSGHIIKRCIDYYEVQTALKDYMAKHP